MSVSAPSFDCASLSFMTAAACIVMVCHLLLATLTQNIPRCVVNTTKSFFLFCLFSLSHCHWQILLAKWHSCGLFWEKKFNYKMRQSLEMSSFSVWASCLRICKTKMRRFSHGPLVWTNHCKDSSPSRGLISFVAWQQAATQMLLWSDLFENCPWLPASPRPPATNVNIFHIFSPFFFLPLNLVIQKNPAKSSPPTGVSLCVYTLTLALAAFYFSVTSENSGFIPSPQLTNPLSFSACNWSAFVLDSAAFDLVLRHNCTRSPGTLEIPTK